MLGTLYGDLVACSFKQNGMKLGDELVREDAFFSDKGLVALAMWNWGQSPFPHFHISTFCKQ